MSSQSGREVDEMLSMPNSEVSEILEADLIHIGKSFLLAILCNLLMQGTLDRNKLSDYGYVRSVVTEYLDIVDTIGVISAIDDQFLESAKDAIAANRPLAAIVLIATSIEHCLNVFYRSILEARGLLSGDITEVIRSNMRAKMGWLMLLVSEHEIPYELKRRITHLIDLRNAIVHYKAVPSSNIDDDDSGSYNIIMQQIQNLDFDNLLTIPDDLEDVLEVILEDTSPEYKLAKETAEAMLAPRRHERSVEGDL